MPCIVLESPLFVFVDISIETADLCAYENIYNFGNIPLTELVGLP
jgi:hypothetical protein